MQGFKIKMAALTTEKLVRKIKIVKKYFANTLKRYSINTKPAQQLMEVFVTTLISFVRVKQRILSL